MNSCRMLLGSLATALTLVTLPSPSATAQSTGAAKAIELCALYTPQDLASFSIPAVGSYSEDPFSSQCKWTSKKSSVSVRRYNNPEDSESIWASIRQKYEKESAASVKDEPNMGSRAFSVVFTNRNGDPPPGAAFFIIQKNRHLLSVWFDTKGPTSERLREQLRPIAKTADSATQ